jgi:hypothetical protein
MLQLPTLLCLLSVFSIQPVCNFIGRMSDGGRSDGDGLIGDGEALLV